MTFPSGGPGGFPGQQPQQGPAYGQPAGGGLKLGLPTMLHLGTALLGLVNLFVAFASLVDVPKGADGVSFYEAGAGWVPVLLFLAGLLSLSSLVPPDRVKPGLLPVAVSLAAVLGFLFSVFTSEGDLGGGGIMVMIFGIIQLLVAVAAFLFDTGIIKAPAPNPYTAQGQFGPPSGGFQQQQPQQFGQPAPGQQTTFAPQQGQFGQQAPGTPPGGFGGPPQQ